MAHCVNPCYYCGGDHPDDPCPARRRDAERWHRLGQYWVARLDPVKCRTCKGSGFFYTDFCAACEGTGIKKFDRAEMCGKSSAP